MPLGRPVSQLWGALQGRSDMFSDSVLAQPPTAPAPNASSRRNNQRKLENDILKRQDERE
jgi:hypothetical protein